MILTNIFIGLILIALGVLGLKYNYTVTNTFGRNSFFERNLGPGSTYLMFQIIAVFVVMFGILFMLSLHDNVAGFLLKPLLDLF